MDKNLQCFLIEVVLKGLRSAVMVEQWKRRWALSCVKVERQSTSDVTHFLK